jgi:hypothetical protein
MEFTIPWVVSVAVAAAPAPIPTALKPTVGAVVLVYEPPVVKVIVFT